MSCSTCMHMDGWMDGCLPIRLYACMHVCIWGEVDSVLISSLTRENHRRTPAKSQKSQINAHYLIAPILIPSVRRRPILFPIAFPTARSWSIPLLCSFNRNARHILESNPWNRALINQSVNSTLIEAASNRFRAFNGVLSLQKLGVSL
jgi:hypothetical protein